MPLNWKGYRLTIPTPILNAVMVDAEEKDWSEIDSCEFGIHIERYTFVVILPFCQSLSQGIPNPCVACSSHAGGTSEKKELSQST